MDACLRVLELIQVLTSCTHTSVIERRGKRQKKTSSGDCAAGEGERTEFLHHSTRGGSRGGGKRPIGGNPSKYAKKASKRNDGPRLPFASRHPIRGLTSHIPSTQPITAPTRVYSSDILFL